MKKLLFFLILLVVLAAGAAGGAAAWFVYTPASGSANEVVVEIPKGASSGQIAALLARNGIVRDARAFKLYVRARKAGGGLRAGEFLFRQDLTPAQVLDTLLHGEVVLHKITVPEGFSAKEIAKVVGASGLGVESEFLALTEDAAFAKSLGVPAPRLEGYLYPDTYSFAKNVGARGIATAMVARYKQAFTPDLQSAAAARGLTEHQAVTLASIVEKETGDPSERGIIAGLYYNRLKIGMKLEADPTIIYGMEMMGTYRGNIRRADIRDPKNQYSTYVIKGLPPGPIASPGGDALRAVAYPTSHDWLFFVATGARGAHVFSKTYEEHVRAVKKYQLRQRAQR